MRRFSPEPHGRLCRTLAPAALVLTTLLGWQSPAAAEASSPDEPHLDMLTPRPIGPEPHPFTLRPGRFQVEIQPLSYSYDRHNLDRDDTRVHSYQLPILLKAGVGEDTEVQLGIETFAWEQTEHVPSGSVDRSRGFGNIELRIKHNFWGNDGGASALAVTPFVQLPTHRHGLDSRAVQGGVMLPYALAITEQVGVDFTPTFAAVRDSADDDYVLEAGQLVTLNYAFIEDWTLFGEFESVITTESGDEWAGSLGVGLTWDIHENRAIEGGANFGLTRAADDLNLFLAIVQRW